MLKKYISQIVAVGALATCSVFAVGCSPNADLPENPDDVGIDAPDGEEDDDDADAAE
jgi:hypothetical protein